MIYNFSFLLKKILSNPEIIIIWSLHIAFKSFDSFDFHLVRMFFVNVVN